VGYLAVILVAVCATLAACGGGGSGSKPADLESALAVKQVSGLFAPGLDGVIAPSCTPAVIPGNFRCTAEPILGPCTPQTKGVCDSRLAPTRVWFDCFPDSGGDADWSCQLVDPPPGAKVFTTAAQRAAPKHAIWVCRTLDADGNKIGPFFIATNDPHGPTEQQGGAMSVDQAQLLALRLRLKLTVDC